MSFLQQCFPTSFALYYVVFSTEYFSRVVFGLLSNLCFVLCSFLWKMVKGWQSTQAEKREKKRMKPKDSADLWALVVFPLLLSFRWSSADDVSRTKGGLFFLSSAWLRWALLFSLSSRCCCTVLKALFFFLPFATIITVTVPSFTGEPIQPLSLASLTRLPTLTSMWGDSGIDWTHSRPTPDKRTHLIKSKRKRSFLLIKRLFFPYEESYNSFQCFFLHLFFSPEHTEDIAILCYNNKIRITPYCLLFFFFSCVCVRARVFLCFTLFFFFAHFCFPLYSIKFDISTICVFFFFFAVFFVSDASS